MCSKVAEPSNPVSQLTIRPVTSLALQWPGRKRPWHRARRGDPDKAAGNLEKHGIDFADAALVLYDDLAVTVPDEDADEERFVTLGMDALGRLQVVVYTWRAERIRIISARAATGRERRRYEGTS